MSLDGIKELAVAAAEGSEDADLATEIVGAVKCEVIDELPRSWVDADSGVVLYYMIMQQAIERPFRLICQDLKMHQRCGIHREWLESGDSIRAMVLVGAGS